MSFKVQHQIRQNASDIRTYLDDLYTWEDEVNKGQQPNKKSTKSANSKTNKENFPIRGQALDDEGNITEEDRHLTESNANETEETAVANAKLKKEHTTTSEYYNAWSKFDVDKEVAKVDNEKPKKAETKPPQPVNPMQKTSGAEKNTKIVIKGGRSSYNEVESLKEKGNLYFKSNELDKAVLLYSEAIEKGTKQQVNDEILTVLYSNRAMTYLKLREYLKAEEDCNSALKINEKHVKSLVRRGQAGKKLEKYKNALRDFEKAGEVEPDNKEIQEEVRLVKKKLETIKEEQKKKTLLPISVTTKPKTTLKVEDYDPDQEVKGEEPKKETAVKSDSVKKESTIPATQATGEMTSEFLGLKDVEGKLVKHDDKEAAKEAQEEAIKQKVHFRLDLNVQEADKKGHYEPVALTKKPKKSALKRKNQFATEEEKPKKKDARITDDEVSKAISHGQELWQKKIQEDYEKSSSTTTTSNGAEASKAQNVTLIANSSEFVNSWKHIKQSEETCEKFLLGQARPERFAEIFAAGADFDLYMELIKFGLKVVERNSELSVGILEGLAQVKRFDINVKSMLASEKKVIKQILEKTRLGQERADEIGKKYKL